jgi:hypothetical protein
MARRLLAEQHHYPECRRKAKDSKLTNVTNHVIVTVLLGSRCGEGRPEVQVVVIETSSHKVIEGQAALTDKGVTQVTCPADTNTCNRCAAVDGQNCTGSDTDFRKLNTEPSLKQVITSTGDLN